MVPEPVHPQAAAVRESAAKVIGHEYRRQSQEFVLGREFRPEPRVADLEGLRFPPHRHLHPQVEIEGLEPAMCNLHKVVVGQLHSLFHVVVYYLHTITAVPNTKLCAWGEEDRGEHVL